MKVEIYGNREVIEKLKDSLLRVLRRYRGIAKIYLEDPPRACLSCIYFPCCKEEVCTEKSKL